MNVYFFGLFHVDVLLWIFDSKGLIVFCLASLSDFFLD